MRTPKVKLDRPQAENKKLSIAERSLIIKKADELRPSNSWRKVASIAVQAVVKNRSMVEGQTGERLDKRCHMQDRNVIEWENQLDSLIQSAFSYGTIPIRFICQIIMTLIRTKPHPKGKTHFSRSWCRSYLKRKSYTYRRLQGQKRKSVVESGILEKSSEQLTELLSQYGPDQVIN